MDTAVTDLCVDIAVAGVAVGLIAFNITLGVALVRAAWGWIRGTVR